METGAKIPFFPKYIYKTEKDSQRSNLLKVFKELSFKALTLL